MRVLVERTIRGKPRRVVGAERDRELEGDAVEREGVGIGVGRGDSVRVRVVVHGAQLSMYAASSGSAPLLTALLLADARAGRQRAPDGGEREDPGSRRRHDHACGGRQHQRDHAIRHVAARGWEA